MPRFLLLITFLLPITALAADESIFNPSGLPIPRFVSLKSDKVNARVGPGTNYQIKWVYTREGLPVEIVEEFGLWRKIRDHENAEGWVQKSLLDGMRTAIATQDASLQREPTAVSNKLATIKKGAVGNVKACELDWCEMDFSGHKGWVAKATLWGVYPNEKIVED